MKPRMLLLYYLLLLAVMVSWTNVAMSPPLPVRILFLVAVIYPGFNDEHGLLVAALTCFWSIASFGYAYSYMPTMPYIYVIVLSFSLFLYWDRHKKVTTRLMGGMNTLIFFFLIYVWVNDAFTESTLGNTAYTLLTIAMLVPFVPVINRRTVTYFSLAFMTVTVVLSYYLMTTRDIFAFGASEYTPELDRIGWSDQNYLGLGVGMGASVAFGCLMNARFYRWYFILYSLATFLISIPVMLLLGSRGALLCLIVSVGIQFMFSNAKKKWKLLLVMAGFVFLYYLYTNEYFDLMENRFEADDGTGSNRMLIWSKKLGAFFNHPDVFDLLFGVGKDQGIGITPILGLNKVGFHNDFVGFFICYGIVGLLFFITMFFRPLMNCGKHTPYRTIVWANLAFMFIGSMTIEPFLMDLYPFYAFLFYTLLLTKVKNISI